MSNLTRHFVINYRLQHKVFEPCSVIWCIIITVVFMRLPKFSSSNISDVEIYANHFPLRPSLKIRQLPKEAKKYPTIFLRRFKTAGNKLYLRDQFMIIPKKLCYELSLIKTRFSLSLYLPISYIDIVYWYLSISSAHMQSSKD